MNCWDNYSQDKKLNDIVRITAIIVYTVYRWCRPLVSRFGTHAGSQLGWCQGTKGWQVSSLLSATWSNWCIIGSKTVTYAHSSLRPHSTLISSSTANSKLGIIARLACTHHSDQYKCMQGKLTLLHDKCGAAMRRLKHIYMCTCMNSLPMWLHVNIFVHYMMHR